MPPKYARIEPTADTFPNFRKDNVQRFDVCIYHTRHCKELYARFMWYQKGKPKFGQASVIINCYRWPLKWVKTKLENDNATNVNTKAEGGADKKA